MGCSTLGCPSQSSPPCTPPHLTPPPQHPEHILTTQGTGEARTGLRRVSWTPPQPSRGDRQGQGQGWVPVRPGRSRQAGSTWLPGRGGSVLARTRAAFSSPASSSCSARAGGSWVAGAGVCRWRGGTCYRPRAARPAQPSSRWRRIKSKPQFQRRAELNLVAGIKLGMKPTLPTVRKAAAWQPRVLSTPETRFFRDCERGEGDMGCVGTGTGAWVVWLKSLRGPTLAPASVPPSGTLCHGDGGGFTWGSSGTGAAPHCGQALLYIPRCQSGHLAPHPPIWAQIPNAASSSTSGGAGRAMPAEHPEAPAPPR